ncbi:hypothetical protein [Nonomuraea fuscirosea]|uniref:hypothetical protein n=1 Tax=Nonomuraea fuscirosea TaxID=1291556 RepID=UPI0033D83152
MEPDSKITAFHGFSSLKGLKIESKGFDVPDRRTLPWLPDGRVAFWGGWGGSMAIMDFDRGVTIAYVMNDMGADLLGSARSAAYVQAVYRALVGSAGQSTQ